MMVRVRWSRCSRVRARVVKGRAKPRLTVVRGQMRAEMWCSRKMVALVVVVAGMLWVVTVTSMMMSMTIRLMNWERSWWMERPKLRVYNLEGKNGSRNILQGVVGATLAIWTIKGVDKVLRVGGGAKEVLGLETRIMVAVVVAGGITTVIAIIKTVAVVRIIEVEVEVESKVVEGRIVGLGRLGCWMKESITMLRKVLLK